MRISWARKIRRNSRKSGISLENCVSKPVNRRLRSRSSRSTLVQPPCIRRARSVAARRLAISFHFDVVTAPHSFSPSPPRLRLLSVALFSIFSGPVLASLHRSLPLSLSLCLFLSLPFSPSIAPSSSVSLVPFMPRTLMHTKKTSWNAARRGRTVTGNVTRDPQCMRAFCPELKFSVDFTSLARLQLGVIHRGERDVSSQDGASASGRALFPPSSHAEVILPSHFQ